MSGSLWVVGMALPVLTVAGVTTVKGEAVVLRHRADGIADSAALAGADWLALQGPQAACGAAGAVARASGAGLASCAVLGDRVEVTVRLVGSLPLVGGVDVSVPAAAVPGDASLLPAPEVPPASR